MIQASRDHSFENRREYYGAVLLLAVAVMLFWWRIWIPSPADRMHFTDDILIKDYPTRVGLYRSVLAGHIPLWDPSQFGGWPGLANCEAGFFYPFNWLLLPFTGSPETAFWVVEWMVLLHLLLSGVGTYRLARYAGLSTRGAMLAAVAFTFCGFHCAHKKHTNMIFTLAWLPWLVLAAERWIQEKNEKHVFRLTCLLALAYLAGHPQSALYCTMFLGARFLYAAWETARRRTSGKTAGIVTGTMPFIVLVVMAFALTSIQWIPTVELIQQGERAQADVFRSSTEFSLPPIELVEAVVPESLRFWTQIEVFYWGMVPLLLALLAWLRGGFDSFFRFLSGAALAAVLLSLGEYLFFYDLTYLMIPGVAWVRAPSRMIYFASLPIALVAGRGLDEIGRIGDSEEGRPLFSVFFRIVPALAGVVTVMVFLVYLAADVTDNPQFTINVQRDLLRVYLYMLMFGGGFMSLQYLYRNGRITHWSLAWLAVFLTWIDLGTHFRTFELGPGAGGYLVDTEVQHIQQSSWNYRTKVYFQGGGDRTLYHGAAQGFPEMDGQSPLTPRIHLEAREDTNLPFPRRINMNMLRLFGVGIVLTDMEGLPLAFQKVTQRMYRLEGLQVRARLLPEQIHVNEEYQRNLLTLQSFPFDKVALVDGRGIQEKSPRRSAGDTLFPKPFLLASCSLEAVKRGAYLIVDGEDHFAGLEQEPGYYIAVGDPLTGEIEAAERFNLMEDLDDPQRLTHLRMLEFIRNIPEGKVVFAAVQDNAADALLPVGLTALRGIGASVDARGYMPEWNAPPPYRLAHAVVGRKGGAIGSALEVISATEALVVQTADSLYVEGAVAPKPRLELVAARDHADKWFRLFSRLKRYEISPAVYESAEIPHNATRTVYPSQEILIFSAPKKLVTYETEDRASIQIGGREFARNEKGYNLVLVNPQTLEVEKSEVFNLLDDFDPAIAPSGDISEASPVNRAMREFIASVTEGYYILGAIRDEATDLMTRETLSELHRLGSRLTFDLSNAEARKRISHAFFAVKGASICVEASGRERDSIVFTRYPGGPALTRDDLDISEIRFVPVNPVEEMLKLAVPPPGKRREEPGPTWAALDDGPNRIRVSGMSQSGGMLFVSEMFYPGWEAWVDGVKQPIRRVNYYFRGIALPPGPHTVELVYRPLSFRYGAMVSLVGAIGMGLWWLGARKHRG